MHMCDIMHTRITCSLCVYAYMYHAHTHICIITQHTCIVMQPCVCTYLKHGTHTCLIMPHTMYHHAASWMHTYTQQHTTLTHVLLCSKHTYHHAVGLHTHTRSIMPTSIYVLSMSAYMSPDTQDTRVSTTDTKSTFLKLLRSFQRQDTASRRILGVEGIELYLCIHDFLKYCIMFIITRFSVAAPAFVSSTCIRENIQQHNWGNRQQGGVHAWQCWEVILLIQPSSASGAGKLLLQRARE